MWKILFYVFIAFVIGVIIGFLMAALCHIQKDNKTTN